MDDQKMIDALHRIAEAQENQTKEFQAVKSELHDIKKAIDRIDAKLDSTTRETTINSQQISNLKEAFVDEKCKMEKQLDIVHESMRRRDSTLKWIVATIIIPIALAVFAIFKPN